MDPNERRTTLCRKIKSLKFVRASIACEKCELFVGDRRRRVRWCGQKITTQLDRSCVGDGKARLQPAKVAQLPLLERRTTSECFNDVEKFCRCCPIALMSRFQEKQILARIAVQHSDQRNYKALIRTSIKEARESFSDVLQASSVGMKLKIEKHVLAPYKYLGKTANYSVFLRRRKQFSKNFLLHHPLIRQILNRCMLDLPRTLFNLNNRFDRLMGFDEFGKNLACIAELSIKALESFHENIVALVDGGSSSAEANHLRICSGLLSVHISRAIVRTILHVNDFTKSNNHTPFLVLEIGYTDKLTLTPTVEQVFKTIKKFLNEIINAAGKLKALDKKSNRTIYLCLTNEFIENCYSELHRNIQLKYEPILEYIETIEEKYVNIYDDINSAISTQRGIDLIFQDGCNRMLYYKSYLQKVACIRDHEFFKIGEICLREYREHLRECLIEIVTCIFSKLSAQHEWENTDICEAFELIHTRATAKPSTTEELIEIGKFMTWVRDDYLDQLRERVYKGLELLVVLILFGTLSEEHINVNSKVIHWLENITPVIEQNLLEYEQLKFEAEDKLQRVVEDISVHINKVYPLLALLDSMDNIEKVRIYIHNINLHLMKIEEIEKHIQWINCEEISLGFPKSIYQEFDDLKEYVYPFYHLLKLCLDVQRNLSVWFDGQFEMINYETIKITVEKCRSELLSTQKIYKSKLRQAQDENLSLRFKGTVDDPDILNWPAPLKLCSRAIKLIQNFEPSLRVIKILCNEALMERHWKKMCQVAGFDITPNAGTTLRKFIQTGIETNLNEYEIISEEATKEKELHENFIQLRQEWRHINFVIENKDSVELITGLDEIEIVTDDHFMKLCQMQFSIFIKPLKEEVSVFQKFLSTTKNVIYELRIVQWELARLMPLLSCKEIAFQIASEALKFEEIKAIFGKNLEQISSQPNAQHIINNTAILVDLLRCSKLFEIINKGIRSYFDFLRKQFPRLHFLSENEMFAILSMKRAMHKMNEVHLTSIFPCVKKIITDDDEIEILGVSDGSQSLNFLSKVHLDSADSLGICLTQLENEITSTLREMINAALEDYDMQFGAWVARWPSQIILTASQVIFTSVTQKALNLKRLSVSLNDIEQSLNSVLREMQTRTTKQAVRAKLHPLLTLMINNRDSVQNLINDRVESDKDFKWLTLQRYYIIDGLCFVNILEANVEYGYEYLGTIDQSVVTPTTERCHRTLIVALNNSVHGICQGTHGTGKTETIKNLSQSLGKFCLFFQVPAGYQSVFSVDFLWGLLRGVTACGSWLCLENIDNIASDMLAQFARELNEIVKVQNIRKDYERTDVFIAGHQIAARKCFVCLTMKGPPEKLPDGLKQVHRCFSMPPLDYRFLLRIVLISCGFRKWEIFVEKICFCCKFLAGVCLASEVEHGVNVVKYLSNYALNNCIDDEKEVVYQAVKFVYKYKLNAQCEQIIFENIFKSENIIPNQTIDESFAKCFSEACSILKIDYNEDFIKKTLEIHQLITKFNGVIIVGKTLTGKTTLINVLHTVVNLLGGRVEVTSLNPKTLNIDQLFGKFDLECTRWFDGVITKYVRKNNENTKWIVFDGVLDPDWSDGLCSALDSENKICLANGENIKLGKTKFLFEDKNLDHASPKMVYRCGIIVSNKTISWKDIIKHWINNNNFTWCEGIENVLVELLVWITSASLEFIKKNCSQLFKIGDSSLVKTMLSLVEMLVSDAFDANSRQEDEHKNLTAWIHATLLQAGIWGLTATLDTVSRKKFDDFYRLLWRGQNQAHPYPACLERLEIGIPQDGLLTDYTYVYKMKGNWKLWSDLIKSEKIEESDYMVDLFVPTSDSLKINHLIAMHINQKRPIFLHGLQNTGKSLYFKNYFSTKLNRDKYESAHITFTCKISFEKVQNTILSKLHKNRLHYYSPPKGKLCILFIDDVNIPVRDKFDVSAPVELIRHFCDTKKCYDFETLTNIFLENVIFFAACNYKNNLCERFLRHFNVFTLNEINDETVSKIFSNTLIFKWKKSGFGNEIISNANQIVTATLHVYEFAKSNLKPSINKFLYRFNLHNFMKIIRSCVLLKKESVDLNKKLIFILWSNEVLRICGDRLFESNIDELKICIKHCICEYFKEDPEQLFDNCDNANEDVFSLLHFGSYSNNHSFDKINSQQLLELSENALREFNKVHSEKLELVFFDYAIMHLSRICRAISIPKTSLMQIGYCGVGRDALNKLACFICEQKLFKPKFIFNYALEDWRRDIKEALKEAGGLGQLCVIQIREEEFVLDHIFEDIESLMKIGEIPCLYNLDETREILELVRVFAQKGNSTLDIKTDSIFLVYNKLIQENLHFILCFNANNSFLKKNVISYPFLIKHCEIDFFTVWPKDALKSVAETWIESLEFDCDLKPKVAELFGVLYSSIQRKYENERITLSSYLDFIKIFSNLYARKRMYILNVRKRYSEALEKLETAAKQILGMQVSLANYQPQLEAMTRKAVEMTRQIEMETIEVEKASSLVRKDEHTANQQAAAAQILKHECEVDLAQAIPILEDAISALNTLKPTDITLVKSMKNPPDAIKLVMAAVCVIKEVRPDRLPDPSTGRKIIDYWGPSKRILGDMNFLQTLRDFDKDNIKPETMVKIRKDYLPHKDFKPHVVAKASSAAEGLCKWIIAMDMYDNVAKEVAPKKQKLEKAEKEYSITLAILNEKKEQVARIEKKLADLNAVLDEANKKQRNLEREVHSCKKRLTRAQTLISGLTEEKTRWTSALEEQRDEYDRLIGDSLICSGVISCLGQFSEDVRKNFILMLQSEIKCRGVMYNENLRIANFFEAIMNLGVCEFGKRISPYSFFGENILIAKYSKRICLFVDPQKQASAWIKAVEKNNKLNYIKHAVNDFHDIVRCSIISGVPVLLDNVEDIDTQLPSLIYKICYYGDDKEYVKFESELFPCDKNFRLYITTNQKHPQYCTQIHNRMTVIDFKLTEKLLEEMCLTILVEIEMPKMKILRKSISRDKNQCEITLKDIDNKMLNLLSESNIDILEDEEALKNLEESKVLAKNIRAKQTELASSEMELTNTKLNFKPLANFFLTMFMETVKKSHRFQDISKRSKCIVENLNTELFHKVSGAIFNSDKLFFSYLIGLVNTVFKSNFNIDLNDIKCIFEKNPIEIITQDKPSVEWLSNRAWNKICKISELKSFLNFHTFFRENLDTIEKIFIKEIDEKLGHENLNSAFLKLMISSLITPKKLNCAIENFIKTELGETFVKFPRFDIKYKFLESDILTPIFIISTDTCDPLINLKKFAQKNDSELLHVTLRRGANKKFVTLLNRCQTQGGWICVENCHLITPWLPRLELLLDGLDFSNTHVNFRLWLITEMSVSFPISLLENSVKMIKEPAGGIQGKLLDLFQNEPISDHDFYWSCPEKHATFTRLLYSLCLLHCTLQERQSFSAFGWNFLYVFKEFDLKFMLNQLLLVMNSQLDPFSATNYLLEECIHGGYVVDPWDRRVLKVFSREYINTQIITSSYHFNNFKGYGFPRRIDHRDYIEHINKITLFNSVELTGLHNNHKLYKDEKLGENISISITNFFSNKFSAPDYNIVIEKSRRILKELRNNELKTFQMNDAKSGTFFTDSILRHEFRSYQKLITVIKKYLEHLIEEFDEDVLTDISERLATSIYFDKFPEVWISSTYSHQFNLSEYITDLCNRISYFNNFNAAEPVWLGSFFRPRALLYGLKLEILKNTDGYFGKDLIFSAEKAASKERTKLLISGLYLIGGDLDSDGNFLKELSPKTLFTKFNIISLVPMSQSDSCSFFECPIFEVFSASITDNFVESVFVLSKGPSDIWIKRGVAFYCQPPNI